MKVKKIYISWSNKYNCVHKQIKNDRYGKKNGPKILKLHLQFAHCIAENVYERKISSEEEWKVIEKEVKEINESCNGCKIYKMTHSQPLVGLPIAQNFNDLI